MPRRPMMKQKSSILTVKLGDSGAVVNLNIEVFDDESDLDAPRLDKQSSLTLQKTIFQISNSDKSSPTFGEDFEDDEIEISLSRPIIDSDTISSAMTNMYIGTPPLPPSNKSQSITNTSDKRFGVSTTTDSDPVLVDTPKRLSEVLVMD
jgi:hypothetical protein